MRHRMLTLTASLTAASMCSLLFAPSAAASSSTNTTWAATQTRALTLTDATALGSVSASKWMQIVVALPIQNAAALNQYISDISTPGNPQYGQHLTPEAFTETYGPTASQVQAVKAYLESQGLQQISVSPNHLLITASGTAAQIEQAFHTQLSQFHQNGKVVYANTAPAQVPSNLASDVIAVLGLSNATAMTAPVEHPAQTATTISSPNYPASYMPQGFQKAYDVGSTATGSNTSIAIFAEGDLTQVLSDLRAEETANQLPQVPVTVVQTGSPSTDISGVDEWDMDTQYATGMAQTVSQLYLYDAPSLTNADLTTEFNKFATDDLAKAGSASFGECEFAANMDGSMAADDQIFAEAAAQGQTVFASAGDTGGFCPVGAAVNGVPAGAPDVNYPASSPDVVAVGGTTLLTNSDGTYQNELAWTAGGGGSSLFEPAPAWQSGVATSSTLGNKGVPDMAMDADPNSGANVWINGSPQVVGGTSLSSPLALGVWARMESSHSNSLGFAAPLLYAQNGSAGFHDITLGDTGPYPATPGWDFATGLGTIDVSQMNGLIGK